ncbi:hypothetical protein N8I77_002484 [Diaporthe amygdali]|uniref:Phosphoglycerate mutase-like protein n=1 Tax=Phomopsis amygdali TaxID=1214568 RepID=A0AAD9W956_PHOAM|nr:hypothetical protein N8I77_002484 [Diaporthe amygdali]
MVALTHSLVLALASASTAWKTGAERCDAYSHYINYTTVPGFFLQDEASTDPSSFDYTTVSFGLLNRTYPTDSSYGSSVQNQTQWQRFSAYVDALNTNSSNDVAYKVLFLARHGEGYHNAAETFYGTPAWNCYWAEQEGNATATWRDALLTSDGIVQAEKANTFWGSQIASAGLPAPESYYTSPLRRCLYTANITFGGLDLPADRPFTPTIKEFFREGISIHTCDSRSNRTHISSLFPSWEFEPGFPEQDPYWNGITGEDSSSQAARTKIVLDQIFSEDDATWVSVTSHSGEISTILSVLGHRAFRLATGQAIPVLVKAERLYQAYPSATIAGWTSQATCTAPPVTSLATGGCICSSATATATATGLARRG